MSPVLHLFSNGIGTWLEQKVDIQMGASNVVMQKFYFIFLFFGGGVDPTR